MGVVCEREEEREGEREGERERGERERGREREVVGDHNCCWIIFSG